MERNIIGLVLSRQEAELEFNHHQYGGHDGEGNHMKKWAGADFRSDSIGH